MSKFSLMKYMPFGIILFLMMVSCSSLKVNQKVSSDNVTADISDEKKFEFQYQFFEANKYLLQGNYDLALSLFNGCIKIDPNSAVSHFKLASIYLIQKDYQLAEKHAEMAVLSNNSNIWYLHLAGSLYMQNNHLEKAKESFNKLILRDPNKIDFYFNLADIYLKDNDIPGALKVYNTIEENFGISEIISLQKHKLYLALNKKKEALKELENLAKSNSTNIEYRRMIADFHNQNNNINEAIVIYQQLLIEFPKDGFSHIGLAECYRKQGNSDKSFSELTLGFQSEDIPSDVKFNILLSLIQTAGNDVSVQKTAFDLTIILVELYPNDADINTIYANFLLQNKELVKAREVLVKVIGLRKDKYPVWEQLLLLDNEFQDWKSMLQHSDEALLYFPNQSFVYFFNGFSAFQLEKYDQAVKNLDFGNKLVTKEDPLKKDFLTFLAESYFKIGEREKGYLIFDELLIVDSENIMILNNYAYYLSTDNIKLEKAEEMSKITIDKEPNNSTYLDTYAWILFKRSKYNEALVYIEKAIKFDTNISDVVLEHYGDILIHNNKVNEAVNQWIKASELGKGSGLLDKKISNKAYVE